MRETHYAVTPNLTARQMPREIPAGAHQEGDIVTVEEGSFRITGRPHKQQWGARGASLAVYWPAEEVSLDDVPEKMKR